MTRARTLIAHEHRIFVAGLQRLLSKDFDVVFTTADFEGIVGAACGLRPNLLVTGLSRHPAAGLQMISDLRLLVPKMKIAVVTEWEDAALGAEAFRCGASAYILKSCSESELIEGLHAALENRTYVSPELGSDLVGSLARVHNSRQAEKLTDRQAMILKLLAGGKSMKEVATILSVSARTVAFHKYAMMKKLKVASSAELVRFAVKHGFI